MSIKYCNVCGKRFDEWDNQENIHIHQRLGYGSKYDGEYIELDMCLCCLDELIDGCKIFPISTQINNIQVNE